MRKSSKEFPTKVINGQAFQQLLVKASMLSDHFVQVVRLLDFQCQIISFFLQLHEHFQFSIDFSLYSFHIRNQIDIPTPYCFIAKLSFLFNNVALLPYGLKMICEKLLFHIFNLLHHMMVIQLHFMLIIYLIYRRILCSRKPIRFISYQITLL